MINEMEKMEFKHLSVNVWFSYSEIGRIFIYTFN